MKILVVSEGKHELGPDGTPGALIVLVGRVLSVDPNSLTWKDVRDAAVKSHPVKGQQSEHYLKRCLMWLKYAEDRGFHAIVLVIDCDAYVDRIKGTDAAQNDARVSICRAIGVPVETFDAWMLADETALSAALGRTIACQSDPESHGDPKSVCDALLRDSSCGHGMAEFYRLNAVSLRLEVLAKRCASFDKFCGRLRKLVTTAN